jgi:transmembrane sensor
MGTPLTPLQRLGQRAARTQDRALAAARVTEATKARLLAAPPPRSKTRSIALASALAAALLAALVLVLRPSPLAFDLGPAGAGHVGEWIAAPVETALLLRFSDGSRVVLDPRSRARVTASFAAGAQLTIERGSLDAAVVHRQDTRWRVDAGPFSVHVTGTHFTVRWDPETEAFAVHLLDGSVLVTGPLLGEGRAVSTGETLDVSVKDARMHLATSETLTASPPAPSPPAPASSPGAALAVAEAPSARASASPLVAPSPPPPSASPPWRKLASAGRYADAWRGAESEGFDDLCRRASAADLLALADAARFGGGASRAREPLTALRARFPGTREAGLAAFLLGRIAFDQAHAPADAARWFTTYLAEQPGGSFAREAAGRLIEARERTGDSAGAREAARRYLAAYPDGAHAERARSLLDE